MLISFLMLVILGTMRAYAKAREQLGLGHADWSGEQLDTSPNAIDFAFYTTPASPKVVAAILHFPYTAFLVTGLVEAAWLVKRLVDACAPARWTFVVAGGVLWLPAAWLVGFLAGLLVIRLFAGRERLARRRRAAAPTPWGS